MQHASRVREREEQAQWRAHAAPSRNTWRGGEAARRHLVDGEDDEVLRHDVTLGFNR